MKIVFLCGSHPRHMYIANKLYETGLLTGLVVERRENFMPIPPKGLNKQDKANFIRHFAEREKAENKYFGDVDCDGIKQSLHYKEIDPESLNSQETIGFIKGINPDIIISYGVHKLSNEIINICPDKSFNIHGGLSPWFKGCITLFWPFYFLKPNWAGMTIHHLSASIDAGDIVHHSVPILEHGDKLHEVACKAVVQAGEDIVKLMQLLEKGEKLPRVKQTANGKLFTASDWQVQHLRLIYNTFNDDIVDKYLDGEITSPSPNLVRAF